MKLSTKEVSSPFPEGRKQDPLKLGEAFGEGVRGKPGFGWRCYLNPQRTSISHSLGLPQCGKMGGNANLRHYEIESEGMKGWCSTFCFRT